VINPDIQLTGNPFPALIDALKNPRVGVAAPLNRALAGLVDEVAGSPSRAAWFASRPDRLASALGLA
jgi:hypothetical protein